MKFLRKRIESYAYIARMHTQNDQRMAICHWQNSGYEIIGTFDRYMTALEQKPRIHYLRTKCWSLMQSYWLYNAPYRFQFEKVKIHNSTSKSTKSYCPFAVICFAQNSQFFISSSFTSICYEKGTIQYFVLDGHENYRLFYMSDLI